MQKQDEISKWTIVKTKNYERIIEVLNNAFEYSLLYCLIGYSGAGKSTAFKAFLAENKNAVYLRLDKTYSKKDLYVSLLRLFDQHEYGYDIHVRFLAEKLATLIEKRPGKSIIILDDAGRLSAPQLEYLQAIFDSGEGKLGFIISGTAKFHNDFKKWVRTEKLGIPELETRIHSWEILDRPPISELKGVASKNGIVDANDLTAIVKGCKDFRTLRARVLDYKIKLSKKT
jgi:type II secretory pathway predicted ATPase ExeA